jgi:hypothetical protein
VAWRWALVVGVAVVAMAAGSGARADVRPINLDGCPGSCVPVAIGEQVVAEDDAAASITLSRFGGDADDPNSALIFDRKAVPAALEPSASRLTHILRRGDSFGIRLAGSSRGPGRWRGKWRRGFGARPFEGSL